MLSDFMEFSIFLFLFCYSSLFYFYIWLFIINDEGSFNRADWILSSTCSISYDVAIWPSYSLTRLGEVYNHNPSCFQWFSGYKCSTNWPFSQCDFSAEFPEISKIALWYHSHISPGNTKIMNCGILSLRESGLKITARLWW